MAGSDGLVSVSLCRNCGFGALLQLRVTVQSSGCGLRYWQFSSWGWQVLRGRFGTEVCGVWSFTDLRTSVTSTSPEFPIWLRSYYVKHSILAYLILSLYCIILSPFCFFGLLATAPASEAGPLPTVSRKPHVLQCRCTTGKVSRF